MKKVSLFLVLLAIGLLTFAGTALAGPYVSVFSQSSSFTYAPPTGFGFSNATAFGCVTCGSVTATTDTWSTTTTYDGYNGSISTAGASASVSVDTIICEEPPTCGDADGDGVCNESDNCEFTPNTDQADTDDDQIGDACDICPTDPTNTCEDGCDTNQPPTADANGPYTGPNGFNFTLDGSGSVDPEGDDLTYVWEFGDGSADSAPVSDPTNTMDHVYTGAPYDVFTVRLTVTDQCGDSDDTTTSVTLCDDCFPCDDEDQDGVCDADDVCPGIPDDSLECQLEQACPCDNDWVNHGAYVVCVGEFERAHSQEDGIGDVVSVAGCSDCGGSHQGQGCD